MSEQDKPNGEEDYKLHLRQEREHWREEDREERRAEREDQSKLDASWGGINIAVKGSIVVLAILILFDMGLQIYTSGQTNQHLSSQDTSNVELNKAILEAKSAFVHEHRTLVEEVKLNRFYLREIERVCILTSQQREQLQKTLPPSLRELLMQDLSK